MSSTATPLPFGNQRRCRRVWIRRVWDVGALWWFTVDLGRLVFLKKIELKFVDEDLGDPFLLYDVLVSDGRKPIAAQSGNAPPEFFPVLISLKPNKTQRSVEVDLRGITGRRELGGEQMSFWRNRIQLRIWRRSLVRQQTWRRWPDVLSRSS